MNDVNWTEEFGAAITVCDAKGIILAMNAKAIRMFAADGGARLIGSNLLECHPEPARTKVTEMLASGRCNVYTIEKGGTRKLIYQSPWTENGVYAGFVELVLPIPDQMPHFNRDKAKQ